MFVDASALVAIVTREPGWEALAQRAGKAKVRLTSPIAVYEAAMAIARKSGLAADSACTELLSFLAAAGIEAVDVTPGNGAEAVKAFQRFGKGRHRAALNMGDCFSYACAKAHGAPLLFKGGDFELTDIAKA